MLLLLLLALLLLVGALGAAYGLRKECTRGAQSLIVIAPLADGILTYFILLWLGFTTMNGFVGGLMFGYLSLLGIQAILSPRRLLAFRLSWQHLVRKSGKQHS